jgi:hypothetical protein
MRTALDQKNYRKSKNRWLRAKPGQPRKYATAALRQAAWRERKRIADHERLNSEFLSSL